MAKHKEITVVDAIRELKEQDPFQPFRIVMSSGGKYLIENGGNLVEMRTQFFYVSPHSDRFVFLRMSQIAAVEQYERRKTA